MDFFSWMMHPAMMAAGAAAVSLPVIIHLLNRRRFRTVEWAAMDFLLEADRKNRRRVQLENLILLLLRCLIVFLLGLLLSRPFMPGMLASLLQQKQKIERVVLLDDSLSQMAPRGEVTAFESARQSLEKLLEHSAESGSTDNWITLFVTSDPDQPLLSWEPVTVSTLPTLLERIRNIECTQQLSQYNRSLEELVRHLSGQREGTGRVVYLYSDLRRHDWISGSGGNHQDSIRKNLEEIDRLANRKLVIDTSGVDDGNLAIVDVRSDDLLVANRVVRVDVHVANFGDQTAVNVPVAVEIDGQNRMQDVLPQIGPGKTEVVTFRHLFVPASNMSLPVAPEGGNFSGRNGPSGVRNHRVVASIDRPALGEAGLKQDVLAEDSQRQMAVRLLDGIPVLLVDGDPSSMPERSETHYLRNLSVFGTGLLPTVITAAELETVSLSEYRVIFLCNVDELSDDRATMLEQWVREGGAVVFMPGNQVRAEVFNQTFYRDGKGLSPAALDRIDGDPSMSTWVSFEPDSQVHPALKTIVNSDATGLTRVDIFSWWKTMALPDTVQQQTTTAMRLSDAANSPAMIDRSLGNGRVIFFSVPADGDWTMWPAVTGSWVPVMLDLIDYLAGAVADSAEVKIGDPIHWPVDLTVYQSRVSLRDPNQEKTEAIAKIGNGEADESVLAKVEFNTITSSGFLELGLTRIDGQTETVLFAAGLPRDESQLKRSTVSDLQPSLFSEKYEFVPPETPGDGEVAGASSEIWPQIIWILLAILALEQFLAWWFAKRREMPFSGAAR